MLNVSTAFKQKLYNNERDYINALKFTLSDGTILNVGHEHIMDGGIYLDDAVGDDSNFTALGSTICNSLEVTLYNNDEIYSNYVFENAKCEYTVGITVIDNDVENLETLQKGVFTVDEATYGDYTITLRMLDNMEQFDRPYNSSLVYPATLGEIVRDACANCLGSSSDLVTQVFPHYNYSIDTKPSADDTTYRSVLGFCATVAGCFARCNVEGKLELKWFDTDVLENTSNEFDGGIFDSASPYATGDNVNGGTFNPWNTDDEAISDEFTVQIPYHYITDLMSQSIGVDDIVITGVSIEVRVEATESSSDIETYTEGSTDFMIQITNNPFITSDNAEDILDWLSTQLIGLTFRQCNVTHPNDPTIEAGDVGILWDRNGDQHNILITRVTFSPTANQTIVCGAESISKNQSSRITESTRAFIENKKQLRNELIKQKSEYDEAMDELREDIENSNGLYITQETQQDQSIKTYLHNKPLLADSDIRILFSTAGITVTANGRSNNPTWYGISTDGTVIANILNTIGLNFDWGTGGTLTLGGANNGNGTLRILDSSGNQIGYINNTGAGLSGNIIMQSQYGKAQFRSFNIKYKGGLKYNSDIADMNTWLGQGLMVGNPDDTRSWKVSLSGYRSYTETNLHEIFEEVITEYSYQKIIYSSSRHCGYVIDLHPVPNITNRYQNLTTEGISIYPFADDGYTIPSEKVIIHGSTLTIDTGVFGIFLDSDMFYQNNSVPHGSILIGKNDTGYPLIRVESVNRYNTYWDSIDLRCPSGDTYIELGKQSTGYDSECIKLKSDTCEINIEDGEFLITNGMVPQRKRELDGGSYDYLYWNGKELAYSGGSSERYKHDIDILKDESLDPHKLLDLIPKQFILNDDAPMQYPDMKNRLIPGFIAEEVAEIYPSATVRNVDTGKIENWDVRRIVPGMLSLIKEQQEKIEEQENKIQVLENRLQKLEQLMNDLIDKG